MANFGPVSRAEILARLLKQNFFYQIGDYLEKDSIRLAIQPGLKILARFWKPGKIFSPGKRAEKSEKIPCNRNGISAQAEKRARTCAVILFSRKQDGCRYERETISVE